MIVISEALINCTHCKKLVSMRPSFDQDLMQNRQLTEVIVHAATVFQARMNLFIFKPFVHLLRSPEKLMVLLNNQVVIIIIYVDNFLCRTRISPLVLGHS